MNKDKNQLKPELNYVSTMIDDLVDLIDSISSVWDATNIRRVFCKSTLTKKPTSSLTKRKYFLNPNFSGSYYISADAQQIIDGVLIKCFTTLKKHPLSRQHFWQQIAYVLMDWDNKYQIDKVCWYYSRQKALFIYPIKSMFKDLNGLKTEFKYFLIDNYDYDNDNEYFARWFFQ